MRLIWDHRITRIKTCLFAWGKEVKRTFLPSHSYIGKGIALKVPRHRPYLLMGVVFWWRCGPGSAVGIAIDWAGRSGIESRWGRDFPPVQIGPGAHPASCKMGTVSFPGVKCGRGVLLTTHPLLVPLSWKSRAIPLPTLWATPAL